MAIKTQKLLMACKFLLSNIYAFWYWKLHCSAIIEKIIAQMFFYFLKLDFGAKVYSLNVKQYHWVRLIFFGVGIFNCQHESISAYQTKLGVACKSLK